jgi:hypothetical protein
MLNNKDRLADPTLREKGNQKGSWNKRKMVKLDTR